MQIGILQTGHAPDEVQVAHGDFEHMFHRLLGGQGFTFQTWNVVDMDFPTGPEDSDGWLITGSKHGAYEDHAFIPPLEDLIRAIYACARPMVGICFGHQIIAQALGGKVEKYSGGWGLGQSVYDVAGGQMSLNAVHQDQVVTPPKDAKVWASNAFCRNAGLVYGDRAYTLQPHPEFHQDLLATYLTTQRGVATFPSQDIAGAKRRLDVPLDDHTIAGDIAAFFRGQYTPSEV